MKDFSFNPLDSLVFLTIRVGKLLINQFKREGRVSQHPWQPHQVGILVDLWTRDGVRQQDLASSSIRDKASITRVLYSLEQEGLVIRQSDPADKRSKRIFLTPKGKKLREELLPMSEKTIHRALEGIDPADVRVCKRVLKQMYENLNN